MRLICVCGTKGAPGVTTAAFGLARLLGESSKTLFVEADPQGGATATRLGLSAEPGLSSLAASARHGVTSAHLAENTQRASKNLSLLLAPTKPHHARGAITSVCSALASIATEPEGDPQVAVADLGRLEAASPALPLAQATERIVFVTSPSLEGAEALALRLSEMPELRPKSMLLAAGEGPYQSLELAEVLGLPLGARLPFDPAGASAIWSGQSLSKTRRRGLVAELATAIETFGTEDIPTDTTPTARASRLLHLVGGSKQKKEALR